MCTKLKPSSSSNNALGITREILSNKLLESWNVGIESQANSLPHSQAMMYMLPSAILCI